MFFLIFNCSEIIKEATLLLHFQKWDHPTLVLNSTTTTTTTRPKQKKSRFQINHQPDATVFQFIILTFIYSSTCFGRFPAPHQELNDCSGSLWFYRRIVVIVVLCSWSGRLTLMMGGKAPETCWAVNKRQDNKLESCCIWLVIYLNCTMTHGLTNLKTRLYLVCSEVGLHAVLMTHSPPVRLLNIHPIRYKYIGPVYWYLFI